MMCDVVHLQGWFLSVNGEIHVPAGADASWDGDGSETTPEAMIMTSMITIESVFMFAYAIIGKNTSKFEGQSEVDRGIKLS